MTSVDVRAFCRLQGLQSPQDSDEVQEGGEISEGSSFFATRSFLVNTFGEAKDWRKSPHAAPLIAWEKDQGVEDAYVKLLNALQEYKEKNNLVDYEDMLQDEFLMKIPLPTHCVVVDEFQDISPLQKEIVKFWIEQADVAYIAGDDDQALYSFQGADPQLMIKYPAESTVILEKSYRCSEEIWTQAQMLIKRNVNRQDKQVSSNGPGGEVKILRMPDIWDVVQELPKRPGFGEKPKTAFLLLRTNFLVSKIAWKLSDAHIPFRYIDADRDKIYGLTDKKLKLINWVNMNANSSLSTFERLAKEDEYTDAAIRWMKGYVSRLVDRPIVKENITVSIGTIHSSKGKEADTVILFNDITSRVRLNYKQNPEDDRRNFFVGMTRPRTKLVIVDRFFGAGSITFEELGKCSI
jgi:DNA helicase-2/ATP-dependent DNA helicase PcrA